MIRHTPPPETSQETQAGAAVYSPLVLKLYDLWVLGVSNRFAWQCPTRKILLPFYRRHIGERHLEVGVGTGYYLAHTRFAPGQRLSLLDLNPNTLHAASRRIPHPIHGSHAVDVMQPLPPLDGEGFDSIALYYLLHCLPGSLRDKACVFSSLKRQLRPDGVLFGATILGDASGHNGFGRRLMALYNRKGIFGNRHDTLEDLQAVLKAHFGDIQVVQHGKVALFTARQPLNTQTE